MSISASVTVIISAELQNSHICSLEIGQGREDNLEESLELFIWGMLQKVFIPSAEP